MANAYTCPLSVLSPCAVGTAAAALQKLLAGDDLVKQFHWKKLLLRKNPYSNHGELPEFVLFIGVESVRISAEKGFHLADPPNHIQQYADENKLVEPLAGQPMCCAVAFER